MRMKCALLVLTLLSLCISQAGAALVNFTGNVDTDFAVAGAISRADNIGDTQGPAGGCADEPLGQNSFNNPPPSVEQIPPSGFNIERVVTVYDCATDTLYVGLDVCDDPTQKIAWDIDGNGNILTKNTNIVPGFTLKDLFSDEHFEQYLVDIDVNPTPIYNPLTWDPNISILVFSLNGGTVVTTSGVMLPVGVTLGGNAVTGADVEFKLLGVRATFPSPGQASLPIRIQTSSGGPDDFVNEDATRADFDLICQPCISITKGVSCSPDGPFLPSVQALRGATVYFEIEVTNCGTDNLENVVITDSMLNASGALLACTGCTNTASCIPGVINVGNLAAGATATFVCTVPTNPAFAIQGVSPDATNTASVTGVGVLTDIVVNAGPVSANVDVLVPSITCSKLLDNDSNFAVDAGDTTPPTNDLNLPDGGNAWYQFCVTNTGEVPVDFTPGADQNCPAFNDTFIEMLDAQIPGTGVNLDALFLAQLQLQFASNILPAGQTVCVVVGPVLFDETVLCPLRHTFPDTFTACGRATGPGICLPPSGGENVSTGECTAEVSICPPCIDITKQVACAPDGTFADSVTALRGATVYFKITVRNCGGEALNNVTITDTLLTEVDNALLSCSGCTNGLNCIPTSTGLPVQTNIGSLAIGESKSFICTALTNAAFVIPDGLNPDITNRASVTATSATTQTVVNDGPADASVNLLVPGITCSKLLDDDSNFAADAGDLTPPTQHLVFLDNTTDVETAWYRFCVTNTGETAVSFADSGQACPGFTDTFIKVGGTSSLTCTDGSIVIPGTNQDLNALFRAQLILQFGSQSLPAGQMVCITTGPVSFNEDQLCCVENFFPDTFSACGFATGTNICLPPGGGEGVTTGNCNADVTICPPPCIDITKQVSCSPDGPFTESVTALRGATVYFKIVVTNCGGDNLSNVTITDTLTQEVDNALLSCSGCTNGLNCIPTSTGPGVQTNIGTLNVGESKTFICTVLTNGAFVIEASNPDATNSVSVVGTSVRTQQQVSDGPDTATVNLLVPSIACDKLIDDDDNFAADPNDLTPPTCDLDLAQLPIGVKQAWYQLCVENTGETVVDFSAGAGQCPGFTDSFLEIADPQMPGTGVDIDALFRAQLLVQFGSHMLPAGQTVCIVTGPVSFDETVLCPHPPFVDQFSACGLATGIDICLPPADQRIVETGICECQVRICPVDICITKAVSCLPDGPFLPVEQHQSVTVLRGSTIYWQIVVTNCGGEVLNNVTLTDTLTEVDNALLSCGGCTNLPGCIPGVFNLGTLNPSQAKTIVCSFLTNPNFAVLGNPLDAVNTASVTGTGAASGTVVNDGPVTATVDVLVPGIECDLLMDDDSNFDADPGDLTPPAPSLNLAINGPPQVEQVFTKLTVCNTAEVDVNFCAGPDSDCPSFLDPLLTNLDPAIPGTGADIAQMFRDAIQLAYGGCVLPAGQCVSIVVGPLLFDETVLCPNRAFFVSRFTACGIATDPDICLPPNGGERVNTGLCQGSIMLCQPVLFQAYPGDSNGTNFDFMGHLGNSGETISSVPGVFVLVPGDNWSNFVAAAQVQIPYTLKNVTLIKQTPEFIQCADVFPSKVIQQQGTPNIRLRWPLMYEAPGTTFTLIIQYGTGVLWDDDGILGPHIPSYFHENIWEWKVEATLDSMKLLLELFHEVPFATDEVPLIGDEVLYPILQAKLDNIIALVAGQHIREAGIALGEFEMEVADACIGTSPRSPYPTGPGTGIANSEENPACCKILVDAEHVGFALGIFQGSK